MEDVVYFNMWCSTSAYTSWSTHPCCLVQTATYFFHLKKTASRVMNI